MITADEARRNRVNMEKIIDSISDLIKTFSVVQSYLNIEFSGDSEISNFPYLTDSQTEVINEALKKAGYKYKWTIVLGNRLNININW